MGKMQTLIRILLTAILLYFCWQGKIWAIALFLTLNAIAWEYISWNLSRRFN